MARISESEARNILSTLGAGHRDFHSLRSSVVEDLANEARARGYRKPRDANGSLARYFHAYLRRIAKQ